MRTTSKWPLAALVGLGLASSVPAASSTKAETQIADLSGLEIKTSPRRTVVGMPADVQAAAEANNANARAARTPAPAGASATAPAPTAAAAPAVAPSRKSQGTVQPLIEDPMDRLRQRLAEKLAREPLPESSDPHLVRVIANPEPVPAAPLAAPTASAVPIVTDRENELLITAPVRRARPAPAVPIVKTKAPRGHWDYDGENGPQNWAQLKPEFSTCGSGKRQSPIDIRDGISVQLDPVAFDYKPTAFKVIDNGHTVQVNVAPGNTIEVMNRRYELQQFHFHRPSEERINGRQFDMVAHLVHKDLEGRLAVVAVLLDRGSVQPVVQTVWNNLPLEKGEELAAKSEIDLNQLLPAERGYFTYMGSLTTPPCSEGVLWMVMQKPVSISSEQIGIFSRMYPMNARPVQSTSGRMIKGSSN
jgi:carbonic anhydrase